MFVKPIAEQQADKKTAEQVAPQVPGYFIYLD